MAEKTYVGKGKTVGNYGMISFWIDTKKVKPNEKGFIKLTMATMKNTDDRGNTHTVWIDDFVPTPRQEQKVPEANNPMIDQGELPF